MGVAIAERRTGDDLVSSPTSNHYRALLLFNFGPAVIGSACSFTISF